MISRWRQIKAVYGGLILVVGLATGVRASHKDLTGKYAAFYRPLTKTECLEHALNRLTFGPRPGDFEIVQKQGLPKWIKVQLYPEKKPENTLLPQRLELYQTLRADSHEIYTHYPPPQLIRAFARGQGRLPDDPELRATVVSLGTQYREKEQGGELSSAIPSPEQWSSGSDLMRRNSMMAVNPESVVASDLAAGKLLRAIYSDHQLQEILVDFWFNHFNVFIGKGADHYLIPSYEREAIRPHVLGKFDDLLLATAKSPAMLFYLDNWQSVGPQTDARRPQGQRRAQRGLNENYGRELMELHTLGVDGGYTQKDVIEVARCFTGWTIQPPRKGGQFEYNDKVHDKGQKIVLGHLIPAGGGMSDGLTVLNILAHEPATAHFICRELAQKFVADDPPPALVNRMAKTFSTTDGDLRQVMQTMLKSPEFWSQGAFDAKVKTPFELVVSAVRVTNADVEGTYALASVVQRLGEPLYQKVDPTGYSNSNAEWVNSAGLLDRMNFALALTRNRIGGVRINALRWQDDPQLLAESLLQHEPSSQTMSAMKTVLKTNTRLDKAQTFSLIGGLVLGSPEFQRH